MTLTVESVSVFPRTRTHRLEEPSWGEDDESSEHDYYNSIPGKEPPLGGVVDSRLRPSTSLIGHIHTQPQSKAANQVSEIVQCIFG